eukprot:CAMPEP_0114585740 /NCGR_PEP_ID=MMETSP0125-20121206/9191_1 /TAXON_ID=485358 ORGANISM="Aristerostoma sp., Strain ATCC 50986" /NCGR_SAMPLE_ID=MMETSP0125 /ASSEMBLY_ACC=CAM_ASM_000245 /LENGTH=164 /DNA_ID=CAMNT_0001780935 /DNA_START=271 /DNA_END=765 /DNA_ORIENTATION=-
MRNSLASNGNPATQSTAENGVYAPPLLRVGFTIFYSWGYLSNSILVGEGSLNDLGDFKLDVHDSFNQEVDDLALSLIISLMDDFNFFFGLFLQVIFFGIISKSLLNLSLESLFLLLSVGLDFFFGFVSGFLNLDLSFFVGGLDDLVGVSFGVEELSDVGITGHF